MKDTDQKSQNYGAVTCSWCGAYLGNYMNNNFFGLISREFCPTCGKAYRKQYQAAWQRERRKKQKAEKAQMKTELEALRQENEKLRTENIELRRNNV